VSDGRYRDARGYPGRGPAYPLDRYRTADDRAVEAMLASIREPCTASQLASGLDWTLPRTIDALEHLEAALANTGQTLTRIGHHRYTLGPRAGLVHNRKSVAACGTPATLSTFPPPLCCTARLRVRRRTATVTSSAPLRSRRPLTG
jgi:hypothetical protein